MRNSVLPSLLITSALALATAGCPSAAERDAVSIVKRNAAARGGDKAWQAVTSLRMTGTLEAGRPRDPVKLAMSYLRPGKPAQSEARRILAHAEQVDATPQVVLPFTMELKRPRMSRVEVTFQGQTAVQVYDGRRGYKLRPFLGRREVEPFTAEELRQASLQSDLDGPLMSATRDGSRVELEGREPVEEHETWRLKVTSRDGAVRHVWVDTKTYLDVKTDGTRRLDGKLRTVWTYFRDYEAVDGLMVPHVVETVVDGVAGSEKIKVERVAVNPPLDNSRFVKAG